MKNKQDIINEIETEIGIAFTVRQLKFINSLSIEDLGTLQTIIDDTFEVAFDTAGRELHGAPPRVSNVSN